MAIPCQGFTFTWASNSLSEVQELEVDLQRGLPIGRTVVWTPTQGTIRLVGFSATNLTTADYGRRRRLVISAPNPSGGTLTLFDADCIYEGVTIQASTNDAVRFVFTFNVQDTVGAATNP